MMRFSLLNRVWQLKLVGSASLAGIFFTVGGESVFAQIVPDNTLGTESSVVIPNVNIQGIESDRIEGGATRGVNLFHSLQEFNVEEGRGAYFVNPIGIKNILTRVTGGNPSNILGRLGVLGEGNLFLLNPNGILFGPNAELNLQGSFLASTGSSFMFPDGSQFSATNPQLPSLLTISVPLGLQYGSNPGSIQVQGSNLQVNAGETLALVGGQVSIDGGQLQASGGRIELGGLAGEGSVGLNINDSDMGLSFPISDGVLLSDVSLDNATTVDVIAGGGGSIAVNAGNLTLMGESVIYAGIESGLGSVHTKAEDIEINVTEAINLNRAAIINVVFPDAVGNGGNINIATGSLTLTNQAALVVNSGGQGDAGTMNIVARDTVAFNDSWTSSSLEETGVGNSGNINIITGSLGIINGARLDAGTSGKGNGGNINIFARNTVAFDGAGSNGLPTAALSNVELNAIGNAGNVNITAGSLSVRNGALLESRTRGQGNGGSLNINAADTVLFDGSGAFSGVEETGVGKGGNINIITGSLSLKNEATLTVSTFGQGDAGNINIFARNTVFLDGENNPLVSSSIWSNVGSGSVGNGGSINIQAEQLSLRGNAALIGDVEPTGQGQAGDINLDIRGSLFVLGGWIAPTGESARITLGVQPEGIGSGGNLNIRAGSLVFREGGIIKNSTQGQGDAGNIYINADVVDISGSVPSSGLPSGLFTSTDTDGRAGDIVIDTQRFRIADGAALSARSKGNGQGGSIRVNTTTFEAVNGGQLVTTTFGQGQAGNIIVNATNQVTISGSDPNYTNRIAQFPNPIDPFVANAITETGANSGLFANTETDSTGKGGDIRVATSNLNLTDSAQISASTSGRGQGGNLFLTVPEAITINGNGKLSVETSTTGAGGNLTIDTQRLTIQNGAQVSASSTSTNPNGIGGNITVNATESLDLNQASLLAQSNGAAPAGNVRINTGNLTATDARITTSSEQSSGGSITITADQMRLYGNSDITTNVNQGVGGAGNIDLKADSILAFHDSDILAFARDGQGGDITLNTPAFFGENYDSTSSKSDPTTLDNNNRVDVNATGAVSGAITLPDVSLIQNSLTELPENQINTDRLLANSCIVRQNEPTRGSFIITGSGGLPQRPGDAPISTFPTVDLETLPTDSTPSPTNPRRSWQKGDPIIEPQGLYRLPNGKLVLSRNCS